jgi:transposase InsO family protein
VEVEAISQALSPSSNRKYGRARVLAACRLPRSTFNARQKRALHPAPPQRRGPKTTHSDAELLDLIRQSITGSPFHGEGHRKFWARLRIQGVHTSKQRVLRLMRENQLLAPVKAHQGSIVTGKPNQMWGTDATATVTLADGQVTVFAAIDHCTAECVGIHAVKRATRLEALEPIRQGVKEYCGGFRKHVATGLQIRHDHGSQFMSDHFQQEIRFLGMGSSPAFVREPEGNGCIERFFRTLKEQLLWVRHFQDIGELQQALREFRDRYNREWLIERLNFQSPRQARERFLALQQAA